MAVHVIMFNFLVSSGIDGNSNKEHQPFSESHRETLYDMGENRPTGTKFSMEIIDL